MRALVIAVAAAVSALLGLAGVAVAETETPEYEVVRADDDFEIRQYGPMIVAQTRVAGERGEAANEAFRILAAYIFGDNVSETEIAMTAPVTQEPAGEKIAMTAPVTQTPSGGTEGGDEPFWTVGFIMPSKFTMETLPKPTDERITLVEEPGRRLAVLRFSGFAWAGKLEKKAAALRDWLAENGIAPQSDAIFAFYDPPWTPPFMRRNEVMFELAGPPADDQSTKSQ